MVKLLIENGAIVTDRVIFWTESKQIIDYFRSEGYYDKKQENENDAEKINKFFKIIDSSKLKRYISKIFISGNDNNIDTIELEKIDKNIKLIFEFTDITDSNYLCVKLYKYKDYYIILHFDLEGNQKDLFQSIDYQISHYNGNVIKLLNDNIEVIDITDFDLYNFISKYKITQLSTIINLFKLFYDKNNARTKYIEYMNFKF
jgi:hypothetical protein